LNEYRKLFKLSNEHPVIGDFKILEHQKTFFKSKIKHQMDFKKYDYYFWGGY